MNYPTLSRRQALKLPFVTAGLTTLMNPNLAYATDSADFCFALLPDPQYLASKSVCSAQFSDPTPGNWVYVQLMSWIAANQAAWNIKGIVSLGDIVDGGGITNPALAQEPVATTAFGVTRGAGIPDQTCNGNHDCNVQSNDGGFRTNPTSMWTTGIFSVSNMQAFYGSGLNLLTGDGQADKAYWGGYYHDSLSTYTRWEIGRLRIIWISTRFYPADPELDWVQSVAAAHPDHTVMVNTHGYLRQDGGFGNAIINPYGTSGDGFYGPGNYNVGPEHTCYNSGVTMRDRFHAMPNVRFVGCGHDVKSTATATNYKQTVNNLGHNVLGVVTNYQANDQNFVCGGGPPDGTSAVGHVTLMKFRPAAQVVECYVYSVNKQQWCKGNGQYQAGTYMLFSVPFAFVPSSRLFPMPSAIRLNAE